MKIHRWFWIPVVFILDRVSKLWVLAHLAEGEGFPLWKGVFHITRVNNTGAAFGLWLDCPSFLAAITAVSLFAILIHLFRLEHQKRKKQKNFHCWALVAGGALGNLYDRLSFGYVVDFLDFRVWPVFNIADSAICIGVLVVLWNIFRASDPA